MGFWNDEENGSGKESWKDCLSDEDRQVLEMLLMAIKRHKCAYKDAEDPKVAQLWTALVEMKKEINELKDAIGKVKSPFEAMVSVGEAAKRKEVERLVNEIMRPVDEDTKNATNKLVESLMKF